MDPSQISYKVMEENGNNYGALRLKRDTLERLRRLKLTVEASEGREITYDEFVNSMIDKIMK